jgi:PEP-CTERM motif
VLHNSDGITDLGGSAAPNGVASVAWRFNLGDVYAFAFNYVSGGISAVGLVDTGLNIDLVDTSAATGFIGLVGTSAFFGAIAVNAVFPNNIGNDRYFIDDFRINAAAAVPEPASLALVGLALAAAGASARRRVAAGR